MENQTLQRSTFLTVLCILSFINGGLNIVFNIPSLFMGNMMESYSEVIKYSQQTPDYSNAPPFVQEMMNDIFSMVDRLAEKWQVLLLSTILLASMSVIGVWMMWNLRKAGFLFYLTAQTLWTLMPLVFMGVNMFSALAVGFGGFFTAAFIIMYSTRMKEMS